MKVKEIMTKEVTTTDASKSLADAGRLLFQHDCGVLPVVDAMGHVSGVITDRDICRAVTVTGRPAARIPVKESAAPKVYSAAPDDDVETALQTMKAHQVRRLPVLDERGHLEGLLSLNDVVLYAGAGRGVRESAIVDALKGICAHKHVEAA